MRLVRRPSPEAVVTAATSTYHAVRRAVPHERWAAVRRRLHPALRYSLRRIVTSSGPSIGRISVVVPCYNVAAYLRSCLTSIIAQTYPDLEIIVVIDGSPDHSARIAKSFARWDRRIRVIEQANAGLGAARNTGIRAATGDFIAFVDSDDSLPLDAYQLMADSLRRSGSDFAVGNLIRRKGTTEWVPGWAQDVHRHDRHGLTLDDFPEILADVFSWNKLFRRPFFDEAVGSFPEGIRYEDQEPTAKAYASARSFDVLSAVTYRWFIRGDGTSITQQKSQLNDLSDRLTVMRHVSDVLTAKATPKVLDYWKAKSVGLDLRAYYDEVPRTGTDYWDLLRDGVRYVTEDMRPSAWAMVAVQDRLLARMTSADARADVCTALVDRSEHGAGMAVDVTTKPPTARPLYLEDIKFRPSAADLLLSPEEDRLLCVVTGYRAGDDRIDIDGMAYLPGAELPIEQSSLAARLLRCSDGSPLSDVPVAVERFESAALDEIASNAAASHASAGFRASIDTAALLTALSADGGAPREDDAEVYLELTLEAAGSVWRRHVTRRDTRGTANRLEPTPVRGIHRIVPLFSEDLGLRLRRMTASVVADDLAVQGRTVTLTVRSTDGSAITEIALTSTALRLRTSAQVPHPAARATVSVTLPPLPPGAPPIRQFRWRATAHTENGRRSVSVPRAINEYGEALATAGLRAVITRTGMLELLDRKLDAIVTKARTDESTSTVTVEGRAHAPGSASLAVAFAGPNGLWHPRETTWNRATGQFRATFDLVGDLFGHPGVTQPRGGYSFRLLRNPVSIAGSLWVPVVSGAVEASASGVPGWHLGEHAAVRLSVTARARALWVSVEAPFEAQHRTRLGRYRLEQSVPALVTSRPLRDAVLFSCFGGQSAGDSPLALHDELARRSFSGEIYWAVADGSAVVPDTARPVIVGSPEYYDVLHTSRWLVNNNNFPAYFRKRPEQYYLQTWHGTPLKRIGNDVPSASLSLSYRALMQREAQSWDLLLAQNAFAEGVFPSAFGYEGRILSVGYPRNDELARTTRARQTDIRRRLGIPAGSRIALYAPTWRDNRRTSSNRYAAVSYLNVARASKALGSTGTLLLRGHSNTPGFSDAQRYSNVRDVSRYPDIGDLLEIADVLVTDYSSVMFDFAVTGRPILFLTPDLAEYGSSTRGFYLDFEGIAPGPLLGTTEDVLDALDSTGTITEQYRDRYTQFQRTFTPHDDGSAAKRVVDAVWSTER